MIDSWLKRITRVQMLCPLWVLLTAVLSVAVMGALAWQLTLKTSFGELLPQDKESVIVAERVAKRLPSVSTLTVVIDGEDDEALKAFVDALAPRIQAIGPDLVASVDTGAKEARAFFREHRMLYASMALLTEVHDEIESRYAYEVNKAAGFLLDEDDAPPAITEETLQSRLDQHGGGTKGPERFPEYYLDPETHTIAVLVRTPISSGDIDKSNELQARMGEVVDATKAELGDVGKVAYTGNLITSAATHEQIKNDLSHVGLWGAGLILGVVFLFYLRVRTLLAMALTVGIGAVWTFGLAFLLVGHLNSSTGFLFSIVVGNGINFGIIYMARYMEARRHETAEESALSAHRDTWLSTLTAAGAATAAYGSLVVTDFRGFKHFGIIGGSGMLLCWLATYAFLPSILAVSDKLAPIKPEHGWLASVRGVYGRPFAWLVQRAPRTVTFAGVVVTACAAYFAYGYVLDPMEYDMSNIANERQADDTDVRVLSRRVDKIIGRQGQDGLAIATDSLDQVLPLKAALEAVRDRAPEGHKPFGEVVTVYAVLPSQQAEKIELIEATLGRLRKARSRGFIDDAQWAKLEAQLPQHELRELTLEDLPEHVKRSFVEKDGTLGRLVYIVPSKDRSIWDGRYLIDYAAAFRETKLPDGSVVKGSGNQVIYADMIINVSEDAPVAILVSLLGTLLIVVLAFRARREGFLVVVSLAMGLCWMLAVLAVWSSEWSTVGTPSFALAPLKLNFLNFVALPITVGVGADYAVNVMQRHRLVRGDGPARADDIRRVVVETGGAVILCSLTTTLGYSALTLSVNKAIQSFGIAAAAGEICCVIAAVLVLPAALTWAANRRASRGA